MLLNYTPVECKETQYFCRSQNDRGPKIMKFVQCCYFKTGLLGLRIVLGPSQVKCLLLISNILDAITLPEFFGIA